MSSEEHEVAVTTNSPKVAEEAATMTKDVTIQQAVEEGGRRLWRSVASWILDVCTITERDEAMFGDDLTGEPLSTQQVMKAVMLEIDYFRKMGVYTKVSIEQARAGGHQVLGVTWVDVKKAGGAHRSRLVDKDIKPYNATELFAATPPIETLKYIMHIDVTRAYLYAKVHREREREVYVRLATEDQEVGERRTCVASCRRPCMAPETQRRLGRRCAQTMARGLAREARRRCAIFIIANVAHAARYTETTSHLQDWVSFSKRSRGTWGGSSASKYTWPDRSTPQRFEFSTIGFDGRAEESSNYERDHRRADKLIEGLGFHPSPAFGARDPRKSAH